MTARSPKKTPAKKTAIASAMEAGASAQARAQQEQAREPFVVMPARLFQGIVGYLDEKPHRETRALLDAIAGNHKILPAAEVDKLISELTAKQKPA